MRYERRPILFSPLQVVIVVVAALGVWSAFFVLSSAIRLRAVYPDGVPADTDKVTRVSSSVRGGVPMSAACPVGEIPKFKAELDQYFPRWYIHSYLYPGRGEYVFDAAALVFRQIDEPALICRREEIEESFRLFWARHDYQGWVVRIDRQGDAFQLVAKEYLLRRHRPNVVPRRPRVNPFLAAEDSAALVRVLEDSVVEDPQPAVPGPTARAVRTIEREVTEAEWAELQRLIKVAGLWSAEPTGRARGCAGENWIYELTHRATYQMVERWHPDNGAYRDVGIYVLLDLLGVTGDVAPERVVPDPRPNVELKPDPTPTPARLWPFTFKW